MKSLLTLTHEADPKPRKAEFTDRDLAFDVNDPESVEAFGRAVLMGLDGWPMNKIVHYRWKNDLGQSSKDRFLKAWFFTKTQSLVKEKKKCISCGKPQMCRCHDTCNECSPCEVERKAHWSVQNLGRLVRLALPEDHYDDNMENAIRDAIDTGDYRRADIEEDDEN